MPKKISENVVIEKTIGPIDEEEALLAEIKKVLDAQAQASSKSVGPYKVQNGIVTEGEWKGWRAGQCQLSDDPKTPDYVEPGTLSLQYVQFTPQEAENIFLNVADLNKDMLALNTDTNSGKAGIFCYPYQNGVINQRILDTPCKNLYLSESEVANTKCEILKSSIEIAADQIKTKSPWERRLEAFDDGVMIGAGFAVSGMALTGLVGLLAKKFGWWDKMGNFFKNGKNGKNGGPGGTGGASAGGGGRAAEATGAATAALLSAALFAAQSAAAKEALRTLEMIKNSPSIRVHDAPVKSNGAACWGASFALGAAAYFAAGAIAAAGVAAVDIAVEGAVVAGRIAVGAASGVGAWYWNVVWGL